MVYPRAALTFVLGALGAVMLLGWRTGADTRLVFAGQVIVTTDRG